jgi:hypothetical protein
VILRIMIMIMIQHLLKLNMMALVMGAEVYLDHVGCDRVALTESHGP